MIATAHLIAGAGCGRFVKEKIQGLGIIRQIILVLVLGVISHLVLDAISHEEYPKGLESYLTVIVFIELVSVSLLVFSKRNSNRLNFLVFIGMSGAAIPDLMKFASRVINAQWLVNLGDRIHIFHATPHSLPEVGLGWQLVTSLVIAVYFFRSIPE